MTEPTQVPSPLPWEKLEANVGTGHVDTVLVVFTDLLGRMQGRRVHAVHFLDQVRVRGVTARPDLFDVDVDGAPLPGGRRPSWRQGSGDMLLLPDPGTLRPVPWQASTAMVIADVCWPDRRIGPEQGYPPVAVSPRQILQRQLARAADEGYQAMVDVRPEFMLFEDSYENAWNAGYRGLTPIDRYPVDCSVVGTARREAVIRDIRNALVGAGVAVESSRGRRAPGQQELALSPADPQTTADRYAVLRAGAKEIAIRHQLALTFMARFGEAPGNSCPVTMSLQTLNGVPVFGAGPGENAGQQARTVVFRQFVAGVLRTLPDFMLLYAPTVNSYKRFHGASPAPSAVTWGEDNRTCAVRVLGSGEGIRVENRVPGSDANPYLAIAAMIAGGLQGIRENLDLGEPFIGDAFEASLPRVPMSLAEARRAFAESRITREVFGEPVVAQLVRMADAELAAQAAAVTDWERVRFFERF